MIHQEPNLRWMSTTVEGRQKNWQQGIRQEVGGWIS